MPYDEALADRIRALLADEPGLTERRMFGGLGFMLDGHMAVAAAEQDGLLLRCDPAETQAHVTDGVAPFDMGRGPMKGWLAVAPDVVTDDAALASYVAIGVAWVRTLPPKG